MENGDRPHSLQKSDQNKEILTGCEFDNISGEEIARHYMESTTTHGLSRISTAENKFIRAFWTIAFLAILVVLGIGVSKLIGKLSNHRVSITINSQSSSKMAFPAVTICNSNPFRRSVMISEQVNQTAKTNYLQDQDSMRFAAAIGNLSKTELYWLGHSADTFLMEGTKACFFAEQPCNASDFAVYSTPINGNCFLFNAKGDHTQKQLDFGAGLFATFNILQDEYTDTFFWGQGAAGVSLNIHHPEVMPSSSATLMAAPGTLTNIQITKSVIKRLKEPYPDKCSDDKFYEKQLGFSARYSIALCQMMCYVEEQHKQCGYVTHMIYSMMTTLLERNLTHAKYRLATKDSPTACLEAFDAKFKHVADNCTCQPACNEERFKITSSTIKWPSKRKTVEILERMKHFGRNRNLFANWTTQNIHENIVAINIHFKDFAEEHITQFPAYDLNSFAGDLGGLLGLWIGASMFSVFEFLAFALEIIMYCLWWGKSKKHKNQVRVFSKEKAEVNYLD